MIPSKQEYDKAKEIVIAYENEQKRIYDIKVEAFAQDLKEYFSKNLIDGRIKLKEFKLEKSTTGGRGDIIPIDPSLEEYYDGGNNKDIKELCKKHDVNFSIVYWCYHK